MKKYLVILLLFLGIKGFTQNIPVSGFDTLNGRAGYKYTFKPTNYLAPNYVVNDTTVGSHAIDSLKLAATNDTLFARHDGVFYKQFILPASSAGWSLSGNTGASNVFGLTSNNSVRFYSNNLLRAWIDSSNGRFGVGTAAPLSQLDVQSNSIGTTHTTANSVVFRTTTAAALGAPQDGPMFVITGNSFNSLTSLSIPESINIWMTQLSNANPNPAINFGTSLNGAAPAAIMTLSQVATGTMTLTGYINQIAVGTANIFRDFISLSGTTTNRKITFGGTGTVNVQQDNTSSDLYINMASNNSTTFVDTTGAVWIGRATHTNDNSAILDITDTTRGLGLPVLTQSQRDSIGLYVSSLTITNGGSGYTGTPTVTFASTSYPFIKATAGATQSGGVINSATISAQGFYARTPANPTVVGGSGTGAVLTPVMAQRIRLGLKIYCSNCTATDASTGVEQTWNGSTWKNAW